MAVRRNGVERKIDFVDEREQELFASFQLGEDVLRFCKEDPVGIYLHHRIKQTIQQAEVDALKVDPDGWRGWFFGRAKLRALRQRAQAARLLNDWLADAILDGRRAETELETYRD